MKKVNKNLNTLGLTILILTFICGLAYTLTQTQVLAQEKNQKKDDRLGLKITTNFSDCDLYIPANLVEGKGLQVTIPIEDEKDGTAIRIIPVMQNGKISFSVSSIKKKQTDAGSIESERKINTRLASKGESLIIRDEENTSDWEIKVEAISVAENPELFLLEGGCECVVCNNLQICPAEGRCFTSSCGKVCCIAEPN